MIDISYDKNKLNFTLLDAEYQTQCIDNPEFNLYYNNELEGSRTIIKSSREIKAVPIKLSKYRHTTQLFNDHPQSSRYGYLNIHNISPFKPRELIDKYIIENNITFVPPSIYFTIYFHIHFSPSNHCQIYLYIYKTYKEVTTFEAEHILNGFNTQIDALTSQFLQLVNEYSEDFIVFLLGIKMNVGSKSPLLKLLTLSHYNPQYTQKSRKNAEFIIKQITNIHELNKCYFLDMTQDLPSREYNPYINWTTLEQSDFKNAIQEYSTHYYLPLKLQIMQYLSLPLSYVLYETIASNIHTCILRAYMQAKFLFVYDVSKIDQKKEKLDGGLYIQASIDDQKTILNNVAEGDFFSLYGTIIIARNVSYETDHLLDQSNNEQLGVIPTMLKGFFDLRRQLGVEQKIQRQSLKQIIVNVYGLFGSDYYSIYNPICSNYIVKVGREACNIAKKLLLEHKITNNVLQQQTDACLFYLSPIQDQEQFQIKWQELNDSINKELKSFDKIFDFKFEYDKYADRLIIPKAKNTQISLVRKLGQQVIQVKGDLYSEQQSEYRNQVINRYFYDLLTSNCQRQLTEYMGCLCQSQIQNHTSPFCYYMLYDREKTILEQLVKDRAIEQIIKDYSIYVKYSTEESRSLYVQKHYGTNTSCRCLFFGDRIIPIHLVTQSNISNMRVPETISNMLRPIKNVLQGQSHNGTGKNNIYRKGFEERINTYNRINEITEPPGEDQCMLRVESRGSKVFISYYFDEIEELITDNPFKSFHEILHKDINKMYFDIDSKIPINEHILVKCINEAINKLLPTKIEPKMHKCTAFSDQDNQIKEVKYSHHIIIDIKCTKQLNKFLAFQIDQRYRFLTGVQKPIIDIGVYKKNRQSLRLPLCYKITKDEQLDKRPFIIQSNSTFKDFIIGYTKECTVEFQQLIHFDNEFPINPARLCEKFNDTNLTDRVIQEVVAQKTNVQVNQWSIQGKNILCKVEYKCFICSRVHSNDNLFTYSIDDKVYFNCYSNTQRQNNINPPHLLVYNNIDHNKKVKKTLFQQISSIYEDVNEEYIFDTMATQTQQQQHIQFDIQKPTTYIISDMGTGKSQQIKRILGQVQNEYKVLCLSFRRTFSIEFATKYGLKNYMDIKGRMNSSVYKKLIIQIDSLCRYDLSTAPDLLIIDEIESILERIQNCKDNQEIGLKFLKLLEASTNVIYMDGLIEKKTIECLNAFRNAEDWDVVLNRYSPRQDYKYIIIPYIDSMNVHILNYFVKLVKEENKNVYGMITSKRLGFFIKEGLQREDIKVIFYHGSDSRTQEDIDSNTYSSHINVKQKHFKDVNKYWKQYQVVLHNSAITAGVSFDDEHFDLQVNVYQTGTTTPLSFFQGCHRVRKLRNKQVITFLQHSNLKYSNLSPRQIFFKEQQIEANLGINADYNFSKLKQLQLWLHARQECSKAFQTHILSKYLKRMKYQVVIYDETMSLEDNIKGKDFSKQQIRNMEYNRSILRQRVDMDSQDFIYIASCLITPDDQKLYDKDILNSEIGELKTDIPYFKLCKLEIKRSYEMDFDQINDARLTPEHFKILWNGQQDQEFRRSITKALNVSKDPQDHKVWLKNLIDNYRMLRNNNRQTESNETFIMQIIKLAADIIDYYEKKEYDKSQALVHIRQMRMKLNQGNIMNRINSSGIKKIDAIVNRFNQFFNLLMIDVSHRDNKIIFKPILQPIYEYVCGIKPKEQSQNVVELADDLLRGQIIVSRPRCNSYEPDTEVLDI